MDGLDLAQEGGGTGPFRRPGHPFVGREPNRTRTRGREGWSWANFRF
jgi:hypothetical protein